MEEEFAHRDRNRCGRVHRDPVRSVSGDEPAGDAGTQLDSAATRRLAVAARFDCHSNETHTQWWEDIAPGSWWITNHVKEGREKLNFSEWDKHRVESDDAAETVLKGSMPPDYYTWLGLHSDAKLTKAQQRALAAGLEKTLGGG